MLCNGVEEDLVKVLLDHSWDRGPRIVLGAGSCIGYQEDGDEDQENEAHRPTTFQFLRVMGFQYPRVSCAQHRDKAWPWLANSGTQASSR